MDKVMTRIITEVAERNGVDFKIAELAYTDMFKFIRKTLEEVDFSHLETEEDLRQARVNFNIPRIFKMYTTISRINYARESIRKNNPEHDEGIGIDDNPETPRSIKSNTPRTIRISGHTESGEDWTMG